MTMKRPTVCEEPCPKGAAPCHSEAKVFCTECDLCFCINHSSFHEQNCPEAGKKAEKDELIVFLKKQLEVIPVVEDEKKEGE